MAINARPEEGAYSEGRAARRRGVDRGCSGLLAPALARWQAGWGDEEFPLRLAADDERAAILRAGPGLGYVVERPRPKVVQIAALAEGPSSMPALIALRDDGTMWLAVVRDTKAKWRRIALPPIDEEAADGR